MERQETSRRVWLIGLVLALATFAVYAPVLQHDFITFDDHSYVVENSSVQNGITPASIVWAFTTGRASNWHPLTWISHMFDWEIYGLKHPGGHHLTSLLFHIANTLLLFALLRCMTGALWRSAIVAALFAWHPVHVESVAWVAERKDVLSAFFWLLTMLAYVKYVEASKVQSPKVKMWYGLTLLCLALGLMSKPMVVTLPFVLLLMDFWPLRRVGWSAEKSPSSMTLLQLIREKIPFFLLVAISSVVTFLVQRAGGAVIATEKVPLGPRVINALIAYSRYLEKTFWPSGLAVFYPLHANWPLSRIILAAALLIIVSIIALRSVRSQPWLLIGWLWFLGTLVPVIGLVQVGSQSMADRYTYLPLIGIFIAVVWGVCEIFGKDRPCLPDGVWAVFALALIFCLVSTRTQLAYWKDTETLFRHDLLATSDNATAHFNLALDLDSRDRPSEAGNEFAAAIKADPASAFILLGMGRHFAKENNDVGALKYYNAALQANPNYGDAHFNLANLLARQGKFAEAVDHFAAAIRAEPNAADAHNNLGAMLMQLKKWDEAATQFKEALRLRHDYPEAHDELGVALLNLGRVDEAQFQFAEAVRLKPDFTHARLKLGLLLAQRGDFDAAVAQFHAILDLDPQNAEAQYNLAAVFAAQNRLDDAAQWFNSVAALQPNNPDPRIRMGAVYTALGKNVDAIDAYRYALQLKPDAVEALKGLAWVLATSSKPETRNGAEAVTLAEQADKLTGHKQPGVLAALDAAYAEAGRFDDAIKTATETQKLWLSQGRNDMADATARRIELYRAGKPFHQ